MAPRRKDFVPDYRCLGGAYRIKEDWENMRRKITQAKSQVKSRFHDAHDGWQESSGSVQVCGTLRHGLCSHSSSILA
jgi:hypothetical protein